MDKWERAELLARDMSEALADPEPHPMTNRLAWELNRADGSELVEWCRAARDLLNEFAGVVAK